MALPYQDAAWWVLAKLDSALVSAARRHHALPGTSGIRSCSGHSAGAAWPLHRRLRRNWPRLAEDYRAAAADFNSPERWRETFEASVDEPPARQ